MAVVNLIMLLLREGPTSMYFRLKIERAGAKLASQLFPFLENKNTKQTRYVARQ